MILTTKDSYSNALEKANQVFNVFLNASYDQLVKFNSDSFSDLMSVCLRFVNNVIHLKVSEIDFILMAKYSTKFQNDIKQKSGHISESLLKSLETTFIFGVIVHQIVLKPNIGIRKFSSEIDNNIRLWIANCTFADSVYRNFFKKFEPNSYKVFWEFVKLAVDPVLKESNLGFFNRKWLHDDFCKFFYSGYLLSAINDHLTGLIPIHPAIYQQFESLERNIKNR